MANNANNAMVEHAAKSVEEIDKTASAKVELAKLLRNPAPQQGRGPRGGRRERRTLSRSLSAGVSSMLSSGEMNTIKEREPEVNLATLCELSQMSTMNLATLCEVSEMSTTVC